MNIHPIFVHFPIALLTVYAALELMRNKKLLAKETFFYIKASFVIIGILTTSFALQTGESAEHTYDRSSPIYPLINTHSSWANITSWVFGVIAVIYGILIIEKIFLTENVFAQNFLTKIRSLLNPFYRIAHMLYENSAIMITLALFGLAAVTITGSLGGAIVYGPDADPVVHAIYSFFMN